MNTSQRSKECGKRLETRKLKTVMFKEKIKKSKQGMKEQHLPDTCLQTVTGHRET